MPRKRSRELLEKAEMILKGPSAFLAERRKKVGERANLRVMQGQNEARRAATRAKAAELERAKRLDQGRDLRLKRIRRAEKIGTGRFSEYKNPPRPPPSRGKWLGDLPKPQPKKANPPKELKAKRDKPKPKAAPAPVVKKPVKMLPVSAKAEEKKKRRKKAATVARYR